MNTVKLFTNAIVVMDDRGRGKHERSGNIHMEKGENQKDKTKKLEKGSGE